MIAPDDGVSKVDVIHLLPFDSVPGSLQCNGERIDVYLLEKAESERVVDVEWPHLESLFPVG